MHVGYEVIMAVLAFVVLLLLVAEYIIELSPQQLHLIAQLDLIVLLVFALDYIFRVRAAKNKVSYIKGHLIDLVAILPFDSFLRVFRFPVLVEAQTISRIFKLSRFARIAAFTKKIFSRATKLLKTNGLHYMMAVTGSIIFLGAFGILHFEKPYGNIATFGDALWWSLVTTSTVGYGDMAPVTAGGRILAGVLMLTGIGFLGLMTGSVATYFLRNNTASTSKLTVADEEIEYVKHKLDDLNNLSKDDILTLNSVIISVWEHKHAQA